MKTNTIANAVADQLITQTVAKPYNNTLQNVLLSQRFLMDAYGNLQSQNWYQRFLLFKDYFAGLFTLETDDLEFKSIENLFYGYLWQFGELVVSKIKNKYHLFYVLQKNGTGTHIETVLVRPIQMNLPPDKWDYFKPLKFVVNKNCVYVKWRIFPYPALFFYKSFIDTVLELEQAFIKTTIWDTKKFLKMTMNASEKIDQIETESLLDRKTPIIRLLNPSSTIGNNRKDGLLPNIIQPIDTGISMSDQTYTNLINYINYMYNWFGVMVPQTLKKERKTHTESQTDIYNTLNIEAITLRELNTFGTLIGTLYNTTPLKFIRTTEMVSIDQDNQDQSSSGKETRSGKENKNNAP